MISDKKLDRVVRNVIRESIEKKQKIETVYKGARSGIEYHVSIFLREESIEDGMPVLTGGFEYWKTDVDNEMEEENSYIEGSLRIIGNKVVDFDGCYDLPKAIKKALNDNGYSTKW